MNRSLAILFLFAVATGSALADGPGVPKTTFTKAELYTVIGALSKDNGAPLAHGYLAMHRGYLVVVFTTDHGKGKGGFAFYDISDPRQPALVHRVQNELTYTFGEGHGYGFARYKDRDLVALQDGWGVQIWDWTDVKEPVQLSRIKLPPMSGGNYTDTAWWLSFQAPYIYVGGTNTGIHIVDASDPKNPHRVGDPVPIHQTGGFRVGPIFAVGNVLYVSSMEKHRGIATLDISNPTAPSLLDAKPKAEGIYSSMINGNRLYLVGNDQKIYVYDVSDPTNIQYKTVSPKTGGNGGYVVIQDGFVHAGMSRNYAKLAADPPMKVVSRISPKGRGPDWDFCTAVGHLIFISDDHHNGSRIAPHQLAADTTPPLVNMVNPPDGAGDQPLTTRIGITLTDQVDLRTVNSKTMIVRPVGGKAIDGTYSHQTGIVNFSPAQPLHKDTVYEIVVPAGGIKDWAGNAITATFASRFSTTVYENFKAAMRPTPTRHIGDDIRFDLDLKRLPAVTDKIEYSWDFGDGSEATTFAIASAATHRYAKPGHYSVIVRARRGNHYSAATQLQTVIRPVTKQAPTHSSTVILTGGGDRICCVNSDNDSVTIADSNGLKKIAEIPVGKKPRTLAEAPDGRIWVANQDSATVSIVDLKTYKVAQTVRMGYASQPFGICFSPDGRSAWVTLGATGEVAKLDAADPAAPARRFAVGPKPRGIAVSADSSRVFITRFNSPQTHGEVIELSSRGTLVKRHQLAIDPGPDKEDGGRGVPNYLGSPTLAPDGQRLWIPSKKDNVQRGLARDKQKPTFESTVRAIVSQIDVEDGKEVLAARTDLDDRTMPRAIAFSALGDIAFVVSQGSNLVDVLDAYDNHKITSILDTGLAPQGLVLDAKRQRLFVHNFTSRSISVFDVSTILALSTISASRLGTINTVEREKLSKQVLRGKQIFYNARDPRMSKDGYISCAVCHQSGDQDARVFDFTDRGEGLRNTISLLGRRGAGHGRVHWTGNFDEIHDFEHDIRGPFGGSGLMADKQFESGKRNQPLGGEKAGLSKDLDALAAYVSSLDRVPDSPYRNADGSLTAAGTAGRALFAKLKCAECHSGPDYTNSSGGELYDVGTMLPTSGKRLGGKLLGIDTPTLKGIWDTAPYLHDGSAATLMDVLVARNVNGKHGDTASLADKERAQLVSYLMQIDENE
ncbi:MAG: Ig-like domain-containing protein [Planctomycetes bacterium]|nr:Ig-like domain-containing protein [Planctomycetota bacterium]